MPEITGHIQRAQAAGQPGNRTSTRPLTKVSSAAQNANRQLACPDALVKRYRRERSGGSCDEYPFASTAQGGRGASTATSQNANSASKAAPTQASTSANAFSGATTSGSRPVRERRPSRRPHMCRVRRRGAGEGNTIRHASRCSSTTTFRATRSVRARRRALAPGVNATGGKGTKPSAPFRAKRDWSVKRERSGQAIDADGSP
jgi:hypothetical protein